MNVAIVHYHLNRGGVTRVIANQLLALDRALDRSDLVRFLILFGGRSAGWPADLPEKLRSIRLKLCPIPALDYNARSVDSADELSGRLRQILGDSGFSPEETLVHAHNHSLGKNTALPGALKSLADDGFSLLLQIHDFAEDFRPANYRGLRDAIGADRFSAIVYPQAQHIHYAVLNRRDRTNLTRAGVSEERVHFLPNPVPAPDGLPGRADARKQLQRRFSIDPSQRFVLYPVRGIRRKNLGEAVLVAAIAQSGTRVGVTLAPLNPAEQPRYERWKRFAAQQDLPCQFELGEAGGLGFGENLAAADVILTTSVAEGFGMVFLEAWLADRLLTGRNLPEITSDFTASGIRLESMYESVRVPVDWVGRDRFRDTFARVYTAVLESYGETANVTADEVDRWMSAKICGDCVDFADLDEPLQEHVIRRVCDDRSAPGQLCELNASGMPFGYEMDDSDSLIAHNKGVIEREYALEPSGKRLVHVYSKLLGSPRLVTDDTADVEPDRILKGFLDVARFRTLRG